MITFKSRRTRNLTLLLFFLFLLFLAWAFFACLRRLQAFFKKKEVTESLSPAEEEHSPDRDQGQESSSLVPAVARSSFPAGESGRGQDGWTHLPPPQEIMATFNFKFPASRLACRVAVAGRASPVTGQLIGYSQLKKLVEEALRKQNSVFLGDDLDKKNTLTQEKNSVFLGEDLDKKSRRAASQSAGESRALARLLAPYACRLLSLKKSFLSDFL